MINYLSGTYNFNGIEMPEGVDMSTDRKPSDIKEQIRTWLMEDGWSLRQETPQGGLWAFVADDGRGRKIVVGQNINKPDEIILQGQVNVGDDITNKISQMQEVERNKLLWDLRFELLIKYLEFAGIEIPIKSVRVSERIFQDELTKGHFLQRTAEVRKGVLVVLWMLQKQFAQQPPPIQMGFQR